MVTSEVRLEGEFYLQPHELVGVQLRVPVLDDLIPIERFDRVFDHEEPEIIPARHLGERAVLMTLGRPFGFMEGEEGSHYYVETQKTDGIGLTTEQTESGVWVATFRTPHDLSPDDVSLFTKGLKFYDAYAYSKLQDRGGQQPS